MLAAGERCDVERGHARCRDRAVPEPARADEEPSGPQLGRDGTVVGQDGDVAAALQDEDELVAVGVALPRRGPENRKRPIDPRSSVPSHRLVIAGRSFAASRRSCGTSGGRRALDSFRRKPVAASCGAPSRSAVARTARRRRRRGSVRIAQHRVERAIELLASRPSRHRRLASSCAGTGVLAAAAASRHPRCAQLGRDLADRSALREAQLDHRALVIR